MKAPAPAFGLGGVLQVLAAERAAKPVDVVELGKLLAAIAADLRRTSGGRRPRG